VRGVFLILFYFYFFFLSPLLLVLYSRTLVACSMGCCASLQADRLAIARQREKKYWRKKNQKKKKIGGKRESFHQWSKKPSTNRQVAKVKKKRQEKEKKKKKGGGKVNDEGEGQRRDSIHRTVDRPPPRRTLTPNKKRENGGVMKKIKRKPEGSRKNSMSPTSELARREREDEELKAIQHEATRYKDVGKVRFGLQSPRDISNWIQESALKRGDSRRGSKTGRKLCFQLDNQRSGSKRASLDQQATAMNPLRSTHQKWEF